MLLQTNYPYIKSKNSIPAHIVEEFLAEKKQKEQQKPTKGEPLPKQQKAGPATKMRKKAYVSKRHEELKNEVIKRLLNGEYVKLTDFDTPYSETVMQAVLLGACIELREKGEQVLAAHKDNGDRIGFVTYKALSQAYGLPIKPKYDVKPGYEPSAEQYAIDRVELGKKLLAGKLLRINDYCLHHPRYMALKVHAEVVSNSDALVVVFKGRKGKKVAWAREYTLDKLFNKGVA